MNWFSATFSSSIGKKLIMSIAGLFLTVFLLVHLGINFLLLCEDGTSFNLAANFMAKNGVVKVFEVFLFLAIILHIIYGIILQIQNWMARPLRYKVENMTSQTSFFSKWMIHTAAVVFIFMLLHIIDFYFGSKFGGEAAEITLHGKQMHDMYAMVNDEFQEGGLVIFYVIAFIILSFHLNHAFQSAFQTLGINHNKYTQIIKGLGTAYSIIVPLGFAFIAVYVYFVR